jgi:lipopolysaccharide biosynthesis glycosyltransferase
MRVALPNHTVEAIGIVVACDDLYAQHAHIFIASVLASNPKHRFRFFILVPENFSYADRLKKLEERGNCEIKTVEVQTALVADLWVSKHITAATYFRFLMDRLLPSDIHRVLYFDSDIIVKGDLLPLWQIDLSGHVLGAVTDSLANENEDVRQKLGIDNAIKYFNAGMMLIDLAQWRRDNVADQALKFSRESTERLTYWDQCALNYVLKGRVKELDMVWNFQTPHLDLITTSNSERQLLGEARVVHFSASFKPWHYRCTHPLAGLYWKLLKETPWRGYVPPDRTMPNILKRQMRRLLPPWIVRRARALLHPT